MSSSNTVVFTNGYPSPTTTPTRAPSPSRANSWPSTKPLWSAMSTCDEEFRMVSPTKKSDMVVPCIVLTPPHSPFPQPLLEPSPTRRRSKVVSLFSNCSPPPPTYELPTHQNFLLGPPQSRRIRWKWFLVFPLLMWTIHLWLSLSGGEGWMKAGDRLVFGGNEGREALWEQLGGGKADWYEGKEGEGWTRWKDLVVWTPGGKHGVDGGSGVGDRIGDTDITGS